jgi:hypothetical protein
MDSRTTKKGYLTNSIITFDLLNKSITYKIREHSKVFADFIGDYAKILTFGCNMKQWYF